MSKRRLTQQQNRRVTQQRQKPSEGIKLQQENGLLSEERQGLVITSFGKRVLIEDAHREAFNCAIRQHLGKLVAGDQVIWRADIEAGTGVVVSVLPRSHELSRPGFRGQTRMVAANIDFIGIVAPVVPGIHPDMIDRYLVAAEQLKIPAIIILNKTDLLAQDEDWELVAELLQPYDEMGIPLIPASTVSQQGLAELLTFMQDKNSVFVGPSGAGKSSLIQALIPDLEIRIGALSEATGLGKHTTTNSILYHLSADPNQSVYHGNLIDSPGVRQFNPTPCSLNELELCYPDFAPFLGRCKFHNCSHAHEPECAIKNAVENGEIAITRYQSFQRLREEFSAEKH
ncbi:MAG: ribosome small subunit-dependent GTPase A [Thiotrichales bacterium]|nr:ribosome small subunit-dependent GTPase A [Thiotrichales bacterium]